MPDVEVKINSMYPPGASGGIRAYADLGGAVEAGALEGAPS